MEMVLIVTPRATKQYWTGMAWTTVKDNAVRYPKEKAKQIIARRLSGGMTWKTASGKERISYPKTMVHETTAKLFYDCDLE